MARLCVGWTPQHGLGVSNLAWGARLAQAGALADAVPPACCDGLGRLGMGKRVCLQTRRARFGFALLTAQNWRTTSLLGYLRRRRGGLGAA